MTNKAATVEMISPADVQAIADDARLAAVAFVEANRIDVVDLVTLERAVAVRAELLARQNTIVKKLSEPKSWANKLHRWFCSLESAAVGPYMSLDAYERDQIAKFKAEQDRIRAEAERVEADRQRVEQQTRAAAEAAALESAGECEMAAAVVEEAIAAPPPVVALRDQTKDVSGLKFVKRWKWRYAGGPAEVKATPPNVLARTMAMIPREFLCVDEQKVGAYVRSMKDSGKIPGIDIYCVNDPVR